MLHNGGPNAVEGRGRGPGAAQPARAQRCRRRPPHADQEARQLKETGQISQTACCMIYIMIYIYICIMYMLPPEWIFQLVPFRLAVEWIQG